MAQPHVDKWVDSSGGRLAVYLNGTGADTIFLLHGGPGVPDYLEPVALLLAGSHSVIRYDQRGTGRSAPGFTQFDLDAQVEDLEAIRGALGCDRISLFGHSWGGTLGQLYAVAHPHRVSSLFLSNSGIGLGDDWKQMERAVMAHNRKRGGLGGFLLMGLFQVISILPGVGDWGARRLMSLVWLNYFDPPTSAPPPEQEWLMGVRSAPLHRSRSAALATDRHRLSRDALPADLRVAVLFGAQDIYGTTTQLLFDRYPEARHLIVDNCGHVPWFQNPDAFRAELCDFFGC